MRRLYRPLVAGAGAGKRPADYDWQRGRKSRRDVGSAQDIGSSIADAALFAALPLSGLGLIGSSVARAVKAKMPDVRVTGYDADADCA